jgi:PAS domain S-box-containing protein
MSTPKSALSEDGARPNVGNLVVAHMPDLVLDQPAAENAQRALLNILEDFNGERTRMEGAQRATLNILEDFAFEKMQLQSTQRAMVNILGDFSEEKGHLEETQRAAWNILDDFDRERVKVELANQQLGREIEEHKRTGEQLRRASLYSRSLLEASLDPLVTISREGKITDVNHAAEVVTGVVRKQLIDSDFSTYFTEPENARKGYKQVFAQGSVQDYPLAIRHAAGRITEVLYNATLFKDEAGQIEGVFAAARDITRRKRAEEELARRAEELARSNRELQQFAYVASHDLQEPLRMVASFTQLLAQRYEGKLDADADEFIGYAVDGARRMQTLVNDLLDYSRVGTRGKEFTAVDCEKTLQTVLGNLQGTIKESGGQVTHDPLPTVRGDETQLLQALQNLVGNALKFHGPEAPRVHVSAQEIGSEWRFSVRDNGIGIDPQQSERIFLLFQRLHTRDEYPGTGMGLAITKKIVERHGGRIWVDSAPGRGSTFYFSLATKGATHADKLRASSTG